MHSITRNGAKVFLFLLLLQGAGVAQDAPAPSDADTVAVVNGEKITRKELADELIQIIGRRALERLIRLRLVEQEARKQGVDATADEVNARLDSVVNEIIARQLSASGMKSEADLDQFLQRTQGYSLETMKSQTKAELRMLVRAEILAEKVLRKTVTISPEDVQAAFDRKYGTTIMARQIVLASRSEAEEVLAKLKAGADFELTARERSIDAATRPKGGEMRPLAASSTLGSAVADVQPGGLSEIVRTDDGFHILKVIERQEKKKAKLADVEAELREELLRERVDERKASWQTGLLEQATIKRYL